MLLTILLFAFTVPAAVTDALRNKIYNWNTYGGILTALALSAACSFWLMCDAAVEPRLRYWFGCPWPNDGGPGGLLLSDSLYGLLACGLLMVVCFSFFPGIGGGDVKLMAMIGALLG